MQIALRTSPRFRERYVPVSLVANAPVRNFMGRALVRANRHTNGAELRRPGVPASQGEVRSREWPGALQSLHATGHQMRRQQEPPDAARWRK